MLLRPLLAHAASNGDSIACADDSQSLTYSHLLGRARAAAGTLARFPASSPIGLLLPTGVDFIVGFHAILLAGRAVVPINSSLSDEEIFHIVRDSGLAAIVTHASFAPRIAPLGVETIDITAAASMAEPGLATMPTLRSDEELAVLMYTSGTSGIPKGVRLTHGNLHANVESLIEMTGFNAADRFLGLVPLFHAFGLTASVLAPLRLGARVFHCGKFSPAGTINAVRNEKSTVAYAVPSMYAAIMRAGASTDVDLSSIRIAISGGEPLSAAVGDAFFNRFAFPLLEGYGLTETSPCISVNLPGRHRPGSVGRILPGVEVRIADDDGNTVPTRGEGEIWIRGKNVSPGYHRLPAETAAAFTSDGFFKTGDIGRLDDEGFLFITGRKKDLIIVSGEKIAPRMVEDILLRHPGVRDAAVAGRKDALRGEVVVAFVVLAESAPSSVELREFCRAQGLASFQIPREVFPVRDLPRSPTGKLLRRELISRFCGT